MLAACAVMRAVEGVSLAEAEAEQPGAEDCLSCHVIQFGHSSLLPPTMTATLPPADVLCHVTDVHCHPTESEILDTDLESLSIGICAMASRQSDQALVAKLARALPEKVVPCFGPSSMTLLLKNFYRPTCAT